METWGGGRVEGGRLELAGARVSGRDEKSGPWWGRVDLSSGDFRPRATALFTTNVNVRARDARPLLEIASVDLPGWTEKLLRLDEPLVGRAAVRVGRDLVDVRRLAARTGKLEIFGDYAARGNSKAGTFLIDAGLLSVAIGVSGDDRRVRIFGPRKWFRERTGWEPGPQTARRASESERRAIDSTS